MKIFIIPILIVLLGAGSMVALVNAGGTEERSEPELVPLKVDILEVSIGALNSKIYTSGVVQPSQQINLIPQVNGRIVQVADGLQSGRRFAKGDIIAQIEKTEYRLSLRQEKARVGQAKLNLSVEEGRQTSAQREWDILGKEGKAPELTSRRPHLELMKANLDAANASKERAELNLARTTLYAPFNAIVKQEQLDVGQVVGGSPVGILQGTDAFFVRASIPISRLAELELPNGSQQGSEVQVTFSPSPGVSLVKQGRITQLEGELDPQVRTANVLIEIAKPLDEDELPLLLGAYVNVEITGKMFENTSRIPNTALHEGKYVLIADQDNKLARKDVTVGWMEHEEVILLSGLEAGDRIVLTSMSYSLYGSPLEILNKE